MTDFTPTAEQEAIFAAGLSPQGPNLMIHALAGCGKTTTLAELAQRLPSKPALALAFNVRIKKELEKRFPKNFEVKTLNGLGHAAWGRATGKKLTVDKGKLGRLVTEGMKATNVVKERETWTNIRKLVVLAQNAGIVPGAYPHKGFLPDTEAAWQALAEDNFHEVSPDEIGTARFVLENSVKEAFGGIISFDDQIYMSAMFGGQFPRFQTVMVDEAQDLSPLNHVMLKGCAAGRIIACGDEHQAIYAFRGASGDSMDRIRKLRPEELLEGPSAGNDLQVSAGGSGAAAPPCGGLHGSPHKRQGPSTPVAQPGAGKPAQRLGYGKRAGCRWPRPCGLHLPQQCPPNPHRLAPHRQPYRLYHAWPQHRQKPRGLGEENPPGRHNACGPVR